MDLRIIREKLGFTLDELGRRAKIERSRLSRAERGYVTLTELELQRLAEELGILPDELLDPPPLEAA